jgi:hypothetical protein
MPWRLAWREAGKDTVHYGKVQPDVPNIRDDFARYYERLNYNNWDTGIYHYVVSCDADGKVPDDRGTPIHIFHGNQPASFSRDVSSTYVSEYSMPIGWGFTSHSTHGIVLINVFGVTLTAREAAGKFRLRGTWKMKN